MTTGRDRTPVRRLLLVRHGLPDYRGGLPGDEPPGPPLSPIGYEQASQTVPVLARYAPVAIHASPLARALQTADVIARGLDLKVTVNSELKEWHRSEHLYRVTVRAARWLRVWLAGDEQCAVVVSHGSPLLGLMRTALYLPHHGWWHANHPDRVVLDTCDRFEVSMASVFELTFDDDYVTARCLFHPRPRVMQVRHGRHVQYFPRPTGNGENHIVRRLNPGRLIGYSASRL